MNEHTSEFSRVISQHLRGYMTEKRISQDAVARRLGVARSYVSEHTNGKRSPTTDLIDAVAAESGRDPRDLCVELLRRVAADRESEEQRAIRLAAARRPARPIARKPAKKA